MNAILSGYFPLKGIQNKKETAASFEWRSGLRIAYFGGRAGMDCGDF